MENEYGILLTQIIRGAYSRAFVFGYDNDVVTDYLQKKKKVMYDFREQAYQKGIELGTKRNLNLETKLLLLEVKIFNEAFR